MARSSRHMKRPAASAVAYLGWRTERRTDAKGRQQIVYKFGGEKVTNVVTLPLVRAFSR